MDLGLSRLAVGVVGLSMAVIGLFLSVTVPVIVAVLPQLQGRTYEEILVQPRRRIPPRAIQQHPQKNSPPASSHATLESSDSSDTIHSLASSTHHATSTPPSSLHNSPEARTNGLPLASSSKSDGKCRATLQHVCTPQKCSNRATSSASSEKPVPQEYAGTCANGKSRVADGDAKKKTSHPARTPSWLKASPPPSLLHFQSTPRSSAESTRPPAVVSPMRAATFDETALGPNPETHARLRRAGSLFGFRRSSKASGRAGSEPTLVFNATLPMTPIDEGVRSEPASPSLGSHDLHDVSSDAERPAREVKRRVSYLTRLKRKYSGKRKKEEHDDSVVTKESIQANGRGRSLEKRSSRRLCERHRKSATVPTAPAPRTNPYDAPYYFPSPASPEAANYVQLARSENRRTSVSPSTGRTPYGPALASTASPGSGGTTQLPPLAHSASPPQSQNILPIRNVKVPVSAPGRHRKSVSDSAVSPTADEFGFVLPVSPSAGPAHILKGTSLTS